MSTNQEFSFRIIMADHDKNFYNFIEDSEEDEMATLQEGPDPLEVVEVGEEVGEVGPEVAEDVEWDVEVQELAAAAPVAAGEAVVVPAGGGAAGGGPFTWESLVSLLCAVLLEANNVGEGEVGVLEAEAESIGGESTSTSREPTLPQW